MKAATQSAGPALRLDPRVSIAMPVFNGGSFFRQALESALAQTYENIEILVVNDGSNDGGATEETALGYSDHRIRYFSQANGGVAAALNTAVTNMSGEFFCWLSHDDIFLPSKTAKQVAFHLKLGADDAMLFSDYDLIDENGQTIHRVRRDRRPLLRTPRSALLRGYINGCTVFIPACNFDSERPFRVDLRYSQDYDLWNTLLERYEFFHQPETLVQYRLHAGQGTNHGQAVCEGEELWLRMIESRSEIERVQMCGSRQRFYAFMADYLTATPYERTAHQAREAAKQPESSALSVIVEADLTSEAGREFVAALVREADPGTELIIATADDGPSNLYPTQNVYSVSMNGGRAAWRNKAMLSATGDYIALVDAAAPVSINELRSQCRSMQMEGYLVSSASRGFSRALSNLEQANELQFCSAQIAPIDVPHTTIVVHRAIIAAGHQFKNECDVAVDVEFWGPLKRSTPCLYLDRGI